MRVVFVCAIKDSIHDRKCKERVNASSGVEIYNTCNGMSSPGSTQRVVVSEQTNASCSKGQNREIADRSNSLDDTWLSRQRHVKLVKVASMYKVECS